MKKDEKLPPMKRRSDYTVSEMSKLTFRPDHVIRGWCQRGRLPGAKRVANFGRSVWLIPKEVAEDPKWRMEGISECPDPVPGCEMLTLEQAEAATGIPLHSIRRLCSAGFVKGASKRRSEGASRRWFLPRTSVEWLGIACERWSSDPPPEAPAEKSQAGESASITLVLTVSPATASKMLAAAGISGLPVDSLTRIETVIGQEM